MTLMELGQLAYEGYRRTTGGVSLVSGAPLPLWEELAWHIQAAWAVAAGDVACHVMGDTTAKLSKLSEKLPNPPDAPGI